MAKSVAITITQKSQNAETNKSLVNFKCAVTTSGESYRGSSRVASLLIMQDWNQIWYGEVQKGAPQNSTTTFFDFDLEIPHYSDGTSGTITADFNYDSGWCYGTQHATLTTISRQSAIQVDDGILGQPLKITINRKNDTYTHTLEYGFGDARGIIAENVTDTEIYWTPPLELAEQIPYADVGWGGIEATTYNSEGVQIGSKYTDHMYLYIPEDMKPVVDDVWVYDQYADSFSIFLAGMSAPSINIDARGIYGSTIQSYETTIEETTYYGEVFTANKIKKPGSIIISCRVKDTRGRYSEPWETMYEASTYENPKITSLVARRCNANGTYNHQGTYLSVEFTSEVETLGGQNQIDYECQYKKTTETTYKSLWTKDLVSAGKFRFQADAYSTYDIIVRVYDEVGTTAQKSVKGYSARKLLDIWKSKFSIAFGKIAELENAFEVLFGQIKLNGTTKVSIEGGDIDLVPTGSLLYKGATFFGAKQLWNGSSTMGSGQAINLSKNISTMKNGILLVFGRDTAYNLVSFFVPKEAIASNSNTTWVFPMSTSKFDYIGTKTLYITNTSITGHADNTSTAKNANSGITYHNEQFYLKYIYEV